MNSKKITYSGITKLIAVILFAAFFGIAVITACDVAEALDYYNPGASFEEFMSDDYMLTRTVSRLMRSAAENSAVEAGQLAEAGNVGYYAEYGGNVYTNAQELSSFPLDGYYYYAVRENGKWNAGGVVTMYFDGEDAPDEDCRIYVRLNDDYVRDCEKKWNEEKNNFKDGMTVLAIVAAAALVMLIYLLFVCGRRAGEDEICFMAIDRLPTEVLILFAALSVFFGAMVILSMAAEVINNGDMLNIPAGVLSSAVSLLPLTFFMSLVRLFKAGALVKKSLICRFVGYIRKKFDDICSLAKSSVFIKTAVFFTSMLFLYVLASILVMFLTENVIFAIIMLAAAFVYVLCNLKNADEILKGISELKGGNTNYKIPKLGGVFETVAEEVNSIGDGITNAVQTQLKSERMKSELITNVSHDLKTPLTAIINYADLLCKEKLVPEKANEYADIIRSKSEHLKKITSDLFDISKVRSGSAEVKREAIDAMLLIKQTMGELDGEIKKSNLEFIVNAEEDCTAIGDGEKLSRVFENIISNAIKYSMKGSRVYISVKNSEKSVDIEVKNIASYRMDFDDSEITERFVRGDSSRSAEGSGLGLAIAKSYTEACGGTFRIVTDGDLFKCVIGLVKK